VRALTGTDPDRWVEEKRRGLTIDLGFAATTLPSGAGISFVDVPGHVRFLPNMLAGVGAVDACLFVVAATEGWKPQSEEHLRILELLGLRHGVVALTKVGLVDDRLPAHQALRRHSVAVQAGFVRHRRIVAGVRANGKLRGECQRHEFLSEWGHYRSRRCAGRPCRHNTDALQT
jgi:translation initiation factor 2 gamma subunit (eIF-2gamma)